MDDVHACMDDVYMPSGVVLHEIRELRQVVDDMWITYG